MAKNVHELNDTERLLLEEEIKHELSNSSSNWLLIGLLYGISAAVLSGYGVWLFVSYIAVASVLMYVALTYFTRRRARKWLDSFIASSSSPASEQSSDLS
jgi:hypothetical protein